MVFPKKSKKKAITIILVFLVLSFIGLYAGLFLFERMEKSADRKKAEPVTAVGKTDVDKAALESKEPPVRYTHASTVINGNKQEIDILEVDAGSPKVLVRPVLSYDSIFGFEKLSVMAQRYKAYAAVNAGFFYEFGNPSGMVAIDGRLITKSTGRYPVFIINKGKAELREIKSGISFEYRGVKHDIDNINSFGVKGEAVLYTRDFGTDNRAKIANTTVLIKDGVIKDTIKTDTKSEIPKDGMALTLYQPIRTELAEINFREGEPVTISFEPELEKDTQAYECGSWLVKDGKVVIGNKDEWVGVLTNWDPRTAVGIKADGRIILITVDGRQPGYSVGMTSRELGNYLLGLGVKNAAMLDGGASTEMIVEGKIVNRPSYRGTERLLGGAIIIKLTVDN